MAILKPVLSGNKYIGAKYAGPVADLCRHLVFASFATFELAPPEGYNVQTKTAPRPNAWQRPRTTERQEIADFCKKKSQGQSRHQKVTNQLFGLIMYCYYNTTDGSKVLFRTLGALCAGNVGLEKFRACIAAVHQAAKGSGQAPSFLFSKGDGRRGTGKADDGNSRTYRQLVEAAIPAWYGVASSIATAIVDGMDAETFHKEFVTKHVPKLPGYSLQYWSKYFYGAIGLHVDDNIVPVAEYTIVGIGPFDMMKSWGVQFAHRSGLIHQLEGLHAIRELTKAVNVVITSAQSPIGVKAAVRFAALQCLTCYDTQVQGCEHKRSQAGLPPSVASVRAHVPLNSAILQHVCCANAVMSIRDTRISVVTGLRHYKLQCSECEKARWWKPCKDTYQDVPACTKSACAKRKAVWLAAGSGGRAGTPAIQCSVCKRRRLLSQSLLGGA